MTLQEKIKQKAEEYGELAQIFIEGAKFVLENQWISVEDDLPCNHEEFMTHSPFPYAKQTVRVLTLISDGDIVIDFMVKYREKWKWWSHNRPTHWMPIPKLPKK